MKVLVIVTGLPRSGKDTSINIIQALLHSQDVPSMTFSSIDPVRDMLKGHVDLSAKTAADRKLLSVVADAMQEHSGFRVRRSLHAMQSFFFDEGEGVFFLQIREPELREEVRARAWNEYEVLTIRLLVSSLRAEQAACRADLVAEMGEFDYTIDNDGDLYDLDKECQRFLHHFHLL